MARAKPITPFALDGVSVTCLLCRNDRFTRQEVKLTTTGMSALNLDWANPSATGLTCARCGYVHLFVNDRLHAMAP